MFVRWAQIAGTQSRAHASREITIYPPWFFHLQTRMPIRCFLFTRGAKQLHLHGHRTDLVHEVNGAPRKMCTVRHLLSSSFVTQNLSRVHPLRSKQQVCTSSPRSYSALDTYMTCNCKMLFIFICSISDCALLQGFVVGYDRLT